MRARRARASSVRQSCGWDFGPAIQSHLDHHTLARNIAVAMLKCFAPPFVNCLITRYRGLMATLGTIIEFRLPPHLSFHFSL